MIRTASLRRTLLALAALTAAMTLSGCGGPYRRACGSPTTANGWYTATAPYRRGSTVDYHRSCNGY